MGGPETADSYPASPEETLRSLSAGVVVEGSSESLGPVSDSALLVALVMASQNMVPRDESSMIRPLGAVAVGGVVMVMGTSTIGVGLGDVLAAAAGVGRISVFAAASSSPIAESMRA